jgi:uncharacterized protein
LDDLKNSLLKDAIDNAKTKADIVAGVKSIIVGEVGLPPPIPVYNTEALESGVGAISAPIIPGQQEISVTVSIVYLIG